MTKSGLTRAQRRELADAKRLEWKRKISKILLEHCDKKDIAIDLILQLKRNNPADVHLIRQAEIELLIEVRQARDAKTFIKRGGEQLCQQS